MCTIYFYNLKGDKEGINFVKKNSVDVMPADAALPQASLQLTTIFKP